MDTEANEIIRKIGELVKNIWKDKENPEGLSKSLNDIAVLNWGLAQWQAEFEEEERQMKAELDLDKANLMEKFVNQDMAVNKAEIRTTIELGEKRRAYNKMASSLEKVKIISRANSAVMDAVRSRLSLIKSEVKNG